MGGVNTWEPAVLLAGKFGAKIENYGDQLSFFPTKLSRLIFRFPHLSLSFCVEGFNF
jgi:hypothetical protein